MNLGWLLILFQCASFAVEGNEPPFRAIGKSAHAGEVWLDTRAQKVWTGPVEGRWHRDDAKNACDSVVFKDFKFRVPTAGEFLEMDRNGGRRHLVDMKDRFFWTQTSHKSSSNVRQVFNGNTGNLFWVMYNNITFDSVRCVAVNK